MAGSEQILDATLQSWAADILAHEPERVAAAFTEDAVFQGFDRTHTVGRTGIAAYYAKQPIGLSAAYRVREVESLGDDAFAAFIDVDFTRPPAEVIPTHLTLVLVRAGAEWLIRHYHVSKLDA
ncbi:SgcJ/EcaC family oxidoreductase [Leifsonia xyli]|uniref:SgcJ/EcaC family oxidoreductase n=1 Tax=Leifsonia xyli TaxID=1575 RepID=UPI003D66FC3C